MENPTDIPGYFAPVHRALIDPILLAGAPRTIAIANGAVWAAKRDAQFAEVARRHLRYPSWLGV
jgi:type IV secretion system protein VirB3